MKKLGLVLDGGGGRGAYQLGIWKYIKEIGLDKHIKVISGCSVGSLNACLLAMDNYDMAYSIWTNEVKDKIICADVDSIKNHILDYTSGNITDTIIKFIANTGIFSRDGLLEIINKYLNLKLISNLNINIYATATHIPSCNAKNFKLNGRSDEDIIQILLASSAIPFVFPTEEIDDNLYIDGGMSDNSPLTPMYEESCTDIIVVHLDTTEVIMDKRENKANIYEIYPSHNLGYFVNGILDFSSKGAEKRIEQGYNDAKNMLGSIIKVNSDGFEIIEKKHSSPSTFKEVVIDKINHTIDDINETKKEIVSELKIKIMDEVKKYLVNKSKKN